MFGVTPDTVSSWVNGLAFRDAAAGPPVVQATTPSRSDCEDEIQFASQEVAGMFVRLGGSVPTDPTTAAYALARRLVLLRVSAWADRSRQRIDPDLAKVRAEDERQIIADIGRNVALLVESRGTSDRSPGLARGGDQPYVRPVGERTSGARLWRSGGA